VTARQLADAILEALREEQRGAIASPSAEKDADQGYLAGLGYAIFTVEELAAAAATPPPCARCRHPYGQHDGWTMGGVPRRSWTPRWGGACSHEVDHRHTCACARYHAA